MPQTPAAPLAFHDHDHSQCCGDGMARAEALLTSAGGKLTPVRRRTLEILLESHRALGAYDVLERLAADGYGKQPPVAYRALEFLVENGLAHRVRRLNAFVACMAPGGPHRPVFLICGTCEAVAECPADDVRRALDAAASAAGFLVERSNIEAVGLCTACREAQS